MRIGIGLPIRAGELSGEEIRIWAARADEGPFSSLATLDRVVFPAHEPLIALASLVGSTSRIRLLASVIIAPTRETTLLARQAASLDSLSGGRFSLGVGVGIRRDDYAATGFAFERRGWRLDEQLPLLRRIWAGTQVVGGVADRIGVPTTRADGPELLIGGYVPAVARRIAAHGDGFMAPGGGAPDQMVALWRAIEQAWSDAGRAGRPRWVGSSYVALGPHADRQAADYIRSAYAFDPALAERRLRGIPTTEATVRALIQRHAALGLDELVLRPCAPDLELADRLADLVGSAPDSEPAQRTDIEA
ncbi:MAG TPA: LLM class flavin-dependent oxidoreductase [Patescibacteria group bacterium]|nr:LLM class flavin-dependent oxidoreductase [Patescibacteria group bacterium]